LQSGPLFVVSGPFNRLGYLGFLRSMNPGP